MVKLFTKIGFTSWRREVLTAPLKLRSFPNKANVFGQYLILELQNSNDSVALFKRCQVYWRIRYFGCCNTGRSMQMTKVEMTKTNLSKDKCRITQNDENPFDENPFVESPKMTKIQMLKLLLTKPNLN